MRCVALSAVLLTAFFPPLHARDANIQRYSLDAERSKLTFRVGKFYGESIAGEFTSADGYLLENRSGDRMVAIELDANGVQVASSRVLSRVARSGSFFGAAQFPTMIFESAWHDSAVLVTGGPVQGSVTIRGVKRRETFRITPAKCSKPGIDCDVEAKGFVNRKAYGIGLDSRILASEVELTLKVRFKQTDS